MEKNDRILYAILSAVAAAVIIVTLKRTRGKKFSIAGVKRVMIGKAGGKPTVDYARVHLSKKNKDAVEWVPANPGIRFSIAFNKGDGTPFGDGHGRPKALFSNADPQSGEIIANPPDPGNGQDFAYSITLDDGSVLDPNIIIH